MPFHRSITHRSTRKVEKRHRNCPRVMLGLIIYIIILVLFSKEWVIIITVTTFLVFGYGFSMYVCIPSLEIETDSDDNLEIEDDVEIAEAIHENNIVNIRRIDATIIHIPTSLNFDDIITPTAAQVITAVPIDSPMNDNIQEAAVISTRDASP